MDILINGIRDTQLFHEMKLFFIHQYFDVMTVEQLNRLVDILMEITTVQDLKSNPSLYQYNTIKYALLIYRICYKIN
jgi:hypothetical protein